jgi:hypothetical protein
MGVVLITGQAPAFGPENIVPVVNRLAAWNWRSSCGTRAGSARSAGPGGWSIRRSAA